MKRRPLSRRGFPTEYRTDSRRNSRKLLWWKDDQLNLFEWIIDTSGFPPRWLCGGGWQDDPWVGWLHIVSDLVTWASYILIPLVLAYFKFGRKDIRLPPVFFLFIAFIFSCGTVHLIEAVIFWWPIYRLSAFVKLVTAVVSLLTVFGMIRVMPKAMTLPSLQRLNDRLKERAVQQEEMLLQLQQSNDDLDAFAYIASHDLKSPLRGVAQLASWIEEDLGQEIGTDVKAHLGILRGRVRRMESLLNDLLDYSSVGRQSTVVNRISLSELTDDVLDLIDCPNGFQIHQQWDDDPYIEAPKPAIKMILMNLITNALKHHDRSTGRVLVSANVRGDDVILRVLDDGPGIDQDFHETIFEPFKTLKSRDETEGTGLGLSIVRKMARRLGGRVSVESQAPAKRGCCVVVTLPQQSSPDLTDNDGGELNV